MQEQIEQLKRVIKTQLLTGQTQLDAWRLRARPQNAAPLTAVFVGDSRAKAWPPPETHAPWRFFNRGIGFDATSHVLRRLDSHVAPLQPYVAIVQAGVNDFKELLLAPEQTTNTIATCQTALTQIVARLQARGAHVVLTTIFPVGKTDSQPDAAFWSVRVRHAADQVMLAVKAVNAHIRSLQTPQVTVFDTSTVLRNENGFLQRQYMRDSLHINAAGYAALNVQLTHILDTLSDSRQAQEKKSTRG